MTTSTPFCPRVDAAIVEIHDELNFRYESTSMLRLTVEQLQFVTQLFACSATSCGSHNDSRIDQPTSTRLFQLVLEDAEALAGMFSSMRINSPNVA
jgi:hypothetical protein